MASKFLSVIHKSTGDYDLKIKIRKSDMSVEAITEAFHEHMYEKLNDSPGTEDEKKIRYLRKRKVKQPKNQRINRQNSKADAEHRTGPDNMNARPEERNVQNAKKCEMLQKKQKSKPHTRT